MVSTKNEYTHIDTDMSYGGLRNKACLPFIHVVFVSLHSYILCITYVICV